MQCHEFEDRLNLLLDERRLPKLDAALGEHAAGCQPCRQLLAGQEVLLAGVAEWKRRQPVLHASGDFSRRVVARAVAAGGQVEPARSLVLQGGKRPTRSAWLLASGLVATAAAVMLALAIAGFRSAGDSNTGVGAVAKNAKQRKAIAPSGTPGKSRQAIAKATPKPGSVAINQRGMPHQPGTLSLLGGPPGGYRAAIADVASTLPDAVEKLDEVERYAPGIRPIRISFTMLLEALWRAIPGMNASEHSQPSTFQPWLDARPLV